MTGQLHMLVCLKIVPKSEEVGVDRETMTLDRGNARDPREQPREGSEQVPFLGC